MSDLDLAPLGTYLPRPIIDRIEVYDNYLSITLSIYLTSPDGSDTATLLEDLEQLNYYLFYAMDSTTIQNLIEKKETIFSGITTVNPSSRPILLAPRKEPSTTDTPYFNVNYHNSQKIASGFGADGDGSNSQWLLKETAGDNDAGFTYKYSTTIDHYFGTEPNNNGSYSPYNFVDLEAGTADFADLSSEYANIMLFTFSSTIDLGESGNSSNKSFRTFDTSAAQYPIFKDGLGYTDESDQQGADQAYYTAMYPTVLGQAARDQYLPDVLIDTQTSEVSYMSVFKDAKLDTNLMNVYVTADGARYETSPLKSLDARYYPTDRVGPDDIAATITELLNRYEGLRSQDSQLDNMMDSIYYVLGAHTDSVDFLGQLAALLSVWPSRVASRPIGRLFNEYQQTIGALNEALKLSGALSRQLSQNFKVIDKRGVVVAASTEYDAALLSGKAWDYGQANPSNGQGQNRYLFNQENNFLISRQVYSDEGEAEHAMNWGFFFVDYEKALYIQTVLSEVLDIDRVENWFGKEIINYGLQWQQASLWRRVGTGYAVGGITATGDFPFAINQIEDVSPANQPNTTSYAFFPVTNTGFYEDLDYSALYPRSFNFARDPGLGDYRLACFYFQDYWGGDQDITEGETLNITTPGAKEHYRIKVELGDRSTETFLELVAAFSKAYTDFNTYYEAAADNCSYNNTDGYFNDFFVTAMNAQYGNDLSQAPWIRMVVVYDLWDDLIHNSFGQNRTALVEAAKTRIARINPETGTLEGIEDFWNMCKEFWDAHLNTAAGNVSIAFQNSDGWQQIGSNDQYYPYTGDEHTQWLHDFHGLVPITREIDAVSPVLPSVFSEIYAPPEEIYEPSWQQVGSTWNIPITLDWSDNDTEAFYGYGLEGCSWDGASDDCVAHEPGIKTGNQNRFEGRWWTFGNTKSLTAAEVIFGPTLQDIEDWWNANRGFLLDNPDVPGSQKGPDVEDRQESERFETRRPVGFKIQGSTPDWTHGEVPARFKAVIKNATQATGGTMRYLDILGTLSITYYEKR